MLHTLFISTVYWGLGRLLFGLGFFRRKPRPEPIPAQLTVVNAHNTGNRVHKKAIIQLELTLQTSDGQPPRTIHAEEAIPIEYLPLLQPQATFPAKIDPSKPTEVGVMVGNWAMFLSI